MTSIDIQNAIQNDDLPSSLNGSEPHTIIPSYIPGESTNIGTDDIQPPVHDITSYELRFSPKEIILTVIGMVGFTTLIYYIGLLLG